MGFLNKRSFFIGFANCINMVAVAIMLFVCCARQPLENWETAVEYSNRSLGTDRTIRENSVLVFPLLFTNRFDTTMATDQIVIKAIHNNFEGPVTFQTKKDFENQFLLNNDTTQLALFYQILYTMDVIKLLSEDAAWKSMRSKYVLFLYLEMGLHIRSFGGVEKRKGVLQTFLYDTDTREMKWQAKTEGYSNVRNQKTDRKFIVKGIVELFSRFPHFLPANSEGVW